MTAYCSTCGSAAAAASAPGTSRARMRAASAYWAQAAWRALISKRSRWSGRSSGPRYSVRRQANRNRFAEEMSAKLGIAVEPVATAREAVRGVDILATCTDSMTPTFSAEWLEPGMHVTMLGPRELSQEVLDRCDVKIRQDIGGVKMTEFRERQGRNRAQPRRLCRRYAGREKAASAQDVGRRFRWRLSGLLRPRHRQSAGADQAMTK